MKNVFSVILVFAIVVVSFCSGFVLYNTVSYGNNGLYIFDYSNSALLGRYVSDFAFGVLNKLSGVASGIDFVASVLLPHPVSAPSPDNLSPNDDCGVFRVKESDGSYSYIVFVRYSNEDSIGTIIFNNSKLLSNYGVGTFINTIAPITDELWLNKMLANFYVVDSMGIPYLNDDGKKVSLSLYYSIWVRRGPQFLTIGDAQVKFSIHILDHLGGGGNF